MSHVRGSILAVLVASSLAACDGSGTSGGSGGGGSGGAGTGGSTGSGTASGTGGSTGSTGTSGPTCHGDATAWAAITAAPIACVKNSDCCVVMNGCLSEAQVVGAADYTTASAAWPYCEDQCNDCIPPAIEIACVNNACVGLSDPNAASDSPLRADHCGVDPGPSVPAGVLHFSCGG